MNRRIKRKLFTMTRGITLANEKRVAARVARYLADEARKHSGKDRYRLVQASRSWAAIGYN